MKKGNTVGWTIEKISPFIPILEISETLYNKADTDFGRKEETLFILNFIFITQVESNFIFCPHDLFECTIKDNGSLFV